MMALVGASSGQTVRLTLDRGLEAWERAQVAFEAAAPAAHPIGRVVLELKFPRTLPVLFKELLAEFRLAPGTLSKYRLAQAALRSMDEGTGEG